MGRLERSDIQEWRQSFASDLHSVAAGVSFVRDIAEAAEAAPGVVARLGIAAEEAIANAIDHGSALNPDLEVEVRCLLKGRILWVVVTDRGGKPFNPDYFLNIATKKLWGKGGRGILMITQIMRSVSYLFRSGRSTTLTLSIDLDPPEDAEEE